MRMELELFGDSRVSPMFCDLLCGFAAMRRGRTLETRNPKSETRNPKPESRNPAPQAGEGGKGERGSEEKKKKEPEKQVPPV